MRRTIHLIAVTLITLALLALGAGSAAAQPLGFSPPRPLHPDAEGYLAEVASDGAGNWVAVWRTMGDTRAWASRSNDNGATWALPVVMAHTPSSDGGLPLDLTTDRLGVWVIVADHWDSNNSLFSRSTDNGATWTSPAVLGVGLSPRVATDGLGNWVAIFRTGVGLMVSRSADGCATWTPPAVLTTGVGHSTRGGQVTTDGWGHWVTVWLSYDDLGGTIGTDSDILVSRSTDNGVTWTPPAALNSNATTDSSDDSQCQVTTDGAGNWVAVWDSTDDLGGTIGTDRDILVSRSTDSGATWTWPEALNADAATDSTVDESHRVATDGLGNWLATWRRLTDTVVSLSTDNGVTWTPPEALTAIPVPINPLPYVATDGLGHWVVVWGGGTNIMVSTSTDLGVVTAVPGWEVYR